MIRLSLFIALTLAVVTTAFPQKISGSRYKLRDTFLRFTGRNCFDITREEGLRALKSGDWDLASSLFRSAKNCADANESRRSEMGTLIGESQSKAKQELIDKEREATRVARHAIASNRAEDAQELLRKYDRSLAFRLADFADRYIAPPDDDQNPDCVQALLDAWNYSPYYHSNENNNPNLELPFCFQIAENLGTQAQIRYAIYKGKNYLFVFSPATEKKVKNVVTTSASTLHWWDAETFERMEPIRLDKEIIGFDVSPDGRTLLFYSRRLFLFWRGPGETTQFDATVSLYSFNEEGTKFFYYQKKDSSIWVKTLSNLFKPKGPTKSRSKGYNNTPLKEELQPVFTSVGAEELLQFSVRKDVLWLCYLDRVEVRDAWSRKSFKMPYRLYEDTQPDQIKIWPEVRRMQYVSDTMDIVYLLPIATSPDGSNITQLVSYGELPLAFDPVGSRYLISLNKQTGHLYIRENGREIKFYSTPSLRQGDWYKRNGGAISADGHWWAALTYGGTLMAYSLGNELHSTTWPFFPTRDISLRFSPNGQLFAANQDDSLRVYAADDWHHAKYRFPSAKDGTIICLTNNLMAHRINDDSIEVFRFADDKRFGFADPLPFGFVHNIVDIDESQNMIVYATGKKVTVQNIEKQNVVFSREFDGRVLETYFVPQRRQVMVVYEPTNLGTKNNNAVRFWSYDRTGGNDLTSLRINNFKEGLVAFSPDAQTLAFANGSKAWVYKLDDLTEEHAFISTGGKEMTAITFSPDNKAVVIGFDQGDIQGFDVHTGNMLFKLPPVATEEMPVFGLYYYDEGTRLRQVLGINVERMVPGPRNNYNSTNTFVSRQMETKAFSPQLIDGTRQLVSFDAEQIRLFDLEKALDFDDNFAKLAESKDLPLIRSFFEYYKTQSEQSNNSELVNHYCERAFTLYSRLDPETQNVLRADMAAMYEGLIWKLILRDKHKEASANILKANTFLDKPFNMPRFSGHTALLRGEQQNAARHYIDWLVALMEMDQIGATEIGFNMLNEEFQEMNDFGILDGRAKAFLCQMFLEPNNNIQDILDCQNNVAANPEKIMDAANAQRWKVFTALINSESRSPSARKRDLQALMPEAQKLLRQKPAERVLYEQYLLSLADSYFDEGYQRKLNGTESLNLYQKALETLDQPNGFQRLDAKRNILKMTVLNSIAAQQRTLRQYDEAAKTMENAMALTKDLKGVEHEGFDWAFEMTWASINLGDLYLFQNKITEAEALFEQANSFMGGDLIRFSDGHAALLRGNRDEALLNYGDLNDNELFAQALFDLERFADRFPNKQTSIKEMSETLIKTLPLSRPNEIIWPLAKYNFVKMQIEFYAANRQWQDARFWSLEAVSLTATEPTLGYYQQAEAYLYASNYHLHESPQNPGLLDSVINLSQRAIQFAQNKDLQTLIVVLTEANLAHALLLRNKTGDREKAIQHYRHFLEQQTQYFENDLQETLLWDFQDLHQYGIQWPNLRDVIQQIMPDVELSPADWQGLGG